MIKHVKKIWGSEDCLVNNSKYCSKFLNLNLGYECSLHYHKDKDETFYILGGVVELDYVDLTKLGVDRFSIDSEKISVFIDSNKIKRVTLRHGEQFRVKPYLAHQFRSVTSNAKILEVSTNHNDNDSYRITNSRQLEGSRFNYGFYE